MTLNEFKAWLEGFEESFEDYGPTVEQYKKIREKLDKVVVLKPIEYKPDALPDSLRGYPKVWL